MKKWLVALSLLLLCSLLFVACDKKKDDKTTFGCTTTPAPTTTTATPAPNPLTAPDFASGASFWSATDAEVIRVGKDYRIIYQRNNSDVNSAASKLRTNIKNVLGSFIDRVDDSLVEGSDRQYVGEKEILIGLTEGRSQITSANALSAQLFAYTSEYVGAFYIGAENGKIVILAGDDASYATAMNFFINNYVKGQSVIEVEGDLSSLYLFDKATSAFLTVAQLNTNGTVGGILVNGQPLTGFAAATTEYAEELYLGAAYPVVSASPYCGASAVTVVQPSEANGGVSTVTVSSVDGTSTFSYTLRFSHLDYRPVDHVFYNLKDGANGVICLVQDDGYWETTQIMLEACEKYDLKFTVAMIANKFGTLATNPDGTYVVDADGQFSFTLKGDSASVSGGGNVGGWKNLVAQNPDRIQIASHTYTHAGWDNNPGKGMGELVGSAQILEAAFGLDVQAFLYAGYSSTYQSQEAQWFRDNVLDHYIVARGGSSGRINSLTSPTWNYLEVCSLYSVTKSLWGTGAHNNDGWFQKGVANAAQNGGWVMTMNHSIKRGNEELDHGNMTITEEYFHYVCKNYIAPYVESGALWSAFFNEAAQYVKQRQNAQLTCYEYSNGSIHVTLTDSLDDDLYYTPMTVDVTVPEGWTSVTLSHDSVTETLQVQTADDGTHYVRLQLVPDRGEAILTAGN